MSAFGKARDLLGETAAGLRANPIRSVSAALGVVVGLATLSASMILGDSLRHRVENQFRDASSPLVEMTLGETPPFINHNRVFERAAAASLPGLTAVATTVRRGPSMVTRGSGTADFYDVFEVRDEWEALFRIEFLRGRAFDGGHSSRDAPVAVVSDTLANDLGVFAVGEGARVTLDGRDHVVIGVFNSEVARADAREAILVPLQPTSIRRIEHSYEIRLLTRSGMANEVANAASQVILPEAPSQLHAIVVPEPAALRRNVDDSLYSTLLALGAVVAVVGFAGIANAMYSSIAQRRSEIGLRRALGATRSWIGLTVTFETTILGGCAGLLGATLGVGAAVLAVKGQGWAYVANETHIIRTAAICVPLSVLSAVGPALRAMRVEPSESLRAA